MTPEGKVKEDIKKWLKAHGFWSAGGDEPAVVKGWYFLPVSMGMGSHGIPDFLGTITKGGRFFSIEAKAPGKKPTDRQLDRHNEIRLAGGIVIIADSVSCMDELEQYL